MNRSNENGREPDEAAELALREIVRRYGTPAYAFDMRRLRAQVDKLQDKLPSAVEILYSLKSNASLGICDVFADCGIGADVASAGELATALTAGFAADRIFVAGPFKLPETIAMLRHTPEAVVSIDSLSELKHLASAGLANSVVLRLRPDFGSCSVVPAGSESRFGLVEDELQDCLPIINSSGLRLVGFHVFAGSQLLDTDMVNEQLRKAMDLSLRAAVLLQFTPTYINLGGGFGIPYAADDEALDLESISAELTRLAERASPARIVLELGRFLVAEAGWYLTSVVGHQTWQGRPAVIVDGGVHQRADMCGLCLRKNQSPPTVLPSLDSSAISQQQIGQQGIGEQGREPTDILGCLSLPDDVMLEASPLPELKAGDVLAFSNAGAYGMWSSPAIFHGSPLPTEAAFDGDSVQLMRERKRAESILDDQLRLRVNQDSSVS